MAGVDLKNKPKVLIIGAGIGGLTLAQILRHNEVPYEIFERSEEFSQKKQGWAVGLVEAVPLLAELLPEDLGDIRETSVNIAVNEPDSVGILDGTTGKQIARLGGVEAGERGFFLRANREHLRNYLSTNIKVSTGKQLIRYVEESDGVTAFFADGSSAHGAILIGADGASSNVRLQLLGTDHAPQLSYNIPMNGMCELSREEYEPLRELGNSVLFAALPRVFFNIGLCSIKSDRSSGVFYWGVAFRSDDPVRDSNWAQNADEQTLYNKCIELIDGLPKWLTSIIQKTGPEGMVLPCIKFVEYVPPEASSFPRGRRVALLGDAAHTMIPFKGAGANTAVTDACDLARLIIRAASNASTGGKNWTGWCDALDEYNTVMLPRGREAVLSSRAAGRDDKGITGIMQGRVATGVANVSQIGILQNGL